MVLRSPSGQWRLERQQALSFAFRLTVLEGFREYLQTDGDIGASLPLPELAERLATATVKMGPGVI
jgi:hypothetical protein